jgi:stearoyl-CoA desaturase (delta-9 desaturase)
VVLSFLIALIVSSIVTQIAVYSTTIYLHRAATHRAVVLHPLAAWVFRFFIWTTTGIVPREWVAVHRKHHAFTDEEGDPHSPLLKGFWKVQLGNFFYYVKELKDPTVVDKYARDLKPDLWDRVLFDRGSIGLLAGIVALCFALGIGWGLFAAVLHAVMYVFVLSSSINGLCHYKGYRNFQNTATNIRFIAWLTGGEGLHNNHHGYPRSPKFSFRQGRRFEFDPGWLIIKALTWVRLARPLKTIEENLKLHGPAQPQELGA